MLIGEYSHQLDEKSRVSLPAKFRKEMGKTVVIAPGVDNCLFVFTIKGWEEFTDRVSRRDSSSVLQADNRNFNRLIIGRAVEVDVDAVGRMLIPEHLKQYASLSLKATIVGVLNRVEVWDTASWEKYREQFSGKTEELAEKLYSTGAI